MTTALLLAGCALLFVPCYLRLGMLNPVTVTVTLWIVIALLFVIRPFNLVDPGLRATVAILAGLAALCAAPVLLARWPGRQPEDREAHARPAGRLVVRLWVLPVASVALLGAVGYGVLAFRSAISAALGGRSFSDLDPKLVRWAELYGNTHVSTLGSIAFGLAPLLGAVAVMGGLFHRWWWYLLLPASLVLTMQSPSRTTTLTLAVSSAFFYLLLSRSPADRLPRRAAHLSNTALLWMLGAAGVLAFLYFGYTSGQLDKSGLSPGLHAASWVPASLAQPLIYEMGGVSAFTVSLEHPVGAHGPYGSFGRSVYAVIRIARLLGSNVPSPEPYATYVNIPTPFNTYTAFGDTYYDLGLAGVIALFALAGLVVHVFSRRPWPGHPGSVWVLCTLAAVLTSTPLHMRLLDIDILIQAIGGWLLLHMMLRRAPRPAPAVRRRELVKVHAPTVAA